MSASTNAKQSNTPTDAETLDDHASNPRVFDPNRSAFVTKDRSAHPDITEVV
eukprot:CAMPEP_0197240036 /NCGR_PEP_ID=MMETSP1429-20130617/6406_1 /TAXON_ID=49237 /ORGANISM="Chaetoceros  sp., Strain UNC1202" /LENGTH=51 /DNA_ID=CAMNT_0042699601 /DNA_START=256 /DNA_END=411 /DNA_ORIENTATION=+